MKIVTKIIFAIVFFIILVISSVCFVMNINKKNNVEPESKVYTSEVIKDECTDEYEVEQQNVSTVYSTEEKVATNAILILKKYYSKCEHTVNEYVELPQEIVNMTKEQVQAHYPDWEVIGFESGKVTLYREFDDVCGEHFKLKIEDGKVVVYIVNVDGGESVYEKTNISSEYLTETDLINMQNGLEVYGKEELNQIIEDFE